MDLEKVDLIELLELLKPVGNNTVENVNLVNSIETIEASDAIGSYKIYELSNQESVNAPLRAVILDNDETTGSYSLVFAFISALSSSMTISHNYLAFIFKRLAFWMFKNNGFRPGIRMLLKKIIEMKKNGYIDAVIMYTNQMDSSSVNFYAAYNSKYPDFLKSGASTIAYMMECLVNEKIFDNILTRNPLDKPNTEGCFPKSFERILQLYPNHPKDITNIVFVDDFACPQFISASGIEKVSEDCWYCIAPYVKKLTSSEIRDCVHFCFKDAIEEEYIYQKVYQYIAQIKVSNRSLCENCDGSFLELCNFLDLKFVFPFYLWIDAKDNDLNKKNSVVVYGQGQQGQQREQSNQTSKTDRRETKRKHEHIE